MESFEREQIEGLAQQRGFVDYRWLGRGQTVVAEWVRMKCTYGCPHYGQLGACPPNLPSVSACRRFFEEYEWGLVLHFAQRSPSREARHEWARQVNQRLLELEHAVFLAGYYKAFLLLMDTCRVCDSCAPTRAECANPRAARPTPEGMCVDVFTTVRKLGYPIEVLRDREEEMNRYAFLMIS